MGEPVDNAFTREVSSKHGLVDWKTLGKGGMGQVYVATDPALNRQIAIKQMSHTDAISRKRFREEMEIMSGLNHGAIVKTTRADVNSQGVPYFFMTYVPGEDLGKHIAKRRLQSKPYTPKEAAEILEPIG